MRAFSSPLYEFVRELHHCYTLKEVRLCVTHKTTTAFPRVHLTTLHPIAPDDETMDVSMLAKLDSDMSLRARKEQLTRIAFDGGGTITTRIGTRPWMYQPIYGPGIPHDDHTHHTHQNSTEGGPLVGILELGFLKSSRQRHTPWMNRSEQLVNQRCWGWGWGLLVFVGVCWCLLVFVGVPLRTMLLAIRTV